MRMLEIMKMGPIVPVMVIDDVKTAVPLAKALVDGGLRVLEITLRTACAIAAVERIVSEVPNAIVGTGTAVLPEHVAASKQAGAQFVVSPGYTQALGQTAKQEDIPLLPGVATSSEIMLALQDGVTELKFFPAVQAGGLDMLKAFSGPFPQVTFCPTGGVKLASAPEFLALPNVACVGGTWVVPKDVIARGDWAEITRLAADASQLGH